MFENFLNKVFKKRFGGRTLFWGEGIAYAKAQRHKTMYLRMETYFECKQAILTDIRMGAGKKSSLRKPVFNSLPAT